MTDCKSIMFVDNSLILKCMDRSTYLRRADELFLYRHLRAAASPHSGLIKLQRTE